MFGLQLRYWIWGLLLILVLILAEGGAHALGVAVQGVFHVIYSAGGTAEGLAGVEGRGSACKH